MSENISNFAGVTQGNYKNNYTEKCRIFESDSNLISPLFK